MRYTFVFLLMYLTPLMAISQQRPDTTFSFTIESPRYTPGAGSTICIDSAHNNFHTLDGGFSPFARVVREDGYRVIDSNKSITIERLEECDIYLIVNPLHESNIGNWTLPNPSAFTEQEIMDLANWVNSGGKFFLIADHMPFAGAAYDLGKSFGIEFSNGFATLEKEQNQPDIFSFENDRLKESPITGDGLTSVTSFTGSAFTYPEEALPVMVFKEGDFSLEPEVAWQFEEDTQTLDLGNYAQGVLIERGKGKVAVFGEAAMFTAQVINQGRENEFRVGINNTGLAPQNLDFLLNLIHWLDE